MLTTCLSPCGEDSLLKRDGSNNEPVDLGTGQGSDDDLQEDDGGKFPVWLKDSEAKLCFGCDMKFTKTIRKHHCRRCRSIYCKSCSSNMSHIYALKTTKPVRVCDRCLNALVKENSYLQTDFPVLQRGEMFKVKQSGSFSIFRGSKIVCLRLLSDACTIIYDDESSNEPTQINPKRVANVVPSGFTTFDIITDNKTHSFEAENSTLCKDWVSHLNHFLEMFHKQPLKDEVEMERQLMKVKCAELKSKASLEDDDAPTLSLEEKRKNRMKERQILKDKYNL